MKLCEQEPVERVSLLLNLLQIHGLRDSCTAHSKETLTQRVKEPF